MLCGNSIDCRGSWSSSQLHRLHPLLQCCPIRLEHAINEWWGQLKANPALHQVSSNLATNHLLCCNRYAISDWSSVCWVNNLQPHLHSFVGNVCCCCSDSSDSRPRECRSVVQREVEVEVPVNKILSLMTFFPFRDRERQRKENSFRSIHSSAHHQ